MKRAAEIIFAALRQDNSAIKYVDANSIDGDPKLIAFFRSRQT